jgi:hypothetical protein
MKTNEHGVSLLLSFILFRRNSDQSLEILSEFEHILLIIIFI